MTEQRVYQEGTDCTYNRGYRKYKQVARSATGLTGKYIWWCGMECTEV